MRSSVQTNSTQYTGGTTIKLNKKKRAMSSLYYIKNNISKQAKNSSESMGVINMEDDLERDAKD